MSSLNDTVLWGYYSPGGPHPPDWFPERSHRRNVGRLTMSPGNCVLIHFILFFQLSSYFPKLLIFQSSKRQLLFTSMLFFFSSSKRGAGFTSPSELFSNDSTTLLWLPPMPFWEEAADHLLNFPPVNSERKGCQPMTPCPAGAWGHTR